MDIHVNSLASQTPSRGLASKTRIEGGREGGKKRWMVRRWEGRGKEEMDGQEVGGKGKGWREWRRREKRQLHCT